MRARVVLAVSVALILGSWGCSGRGNQSPEISLSVQSQQTFQLQDVIRVEVTGIDPDGDRLTFDVEGAPDAPRVSFQTYTNSAIFTWRPAPEDITDERLHRLTFQVEDSHGAQADRVFSVGIRPGNGVPTFETSSSQVYDVATRQPFIFDVVVRDPSNQSVTLFMESGPQGARFEKTGPKQGEFRWAPTDTQAQTRLHSAVFEADDGDNPPVNLEVSLILTDSGSMDTSGGCTDNDQFSSNHTRSGAALVELKTYESMELCPERPDWYQRTVFAGTTLEATVDRLDGASPEELTLEIVDDQGMAVAEGTAGPDGVTATFTPQAQDQYFVRVAAVSELSYAIEFTEP
jgi:hypothetical protein